MGGCTSMSAEEKAAAEQSKTIDKDLDIARTKASKEVKLLLLGTGASGKSTVAKQMHILYLNGFGDNELEEYKRQLAANLVTNMRTLVQAAQKLGISISGSLKQETELILSFQGEDDEFEVEWSDNLFHAMKALWQDSGIQATFARSNEFQLNDSTEYFFNNIDQYQNLKNYQLQYVDVLHIRKRTAGILETKFSVNKLNFTMVDVGGQRNERRKWIHCFEDVTAIIFVAAMSEYDQVLEEDGKTNRMVESLNLFEDTINNDWFKKKPIILFLNKVDLLEKKIPHSNLGDYFPAYKDGPNVEKAKKWISDQYQGRNHNKSRATYVFMTTATNTENIQYVFDSCKDIWITEAIDTISF